MLKQVFLTLSIVSSTILFSQQTNTSYWGYVNTQINSSSDYCLIPYITEVFEIKSSSNISELDLEKTIESHFIAYGRRNSIFLSSDRQYAFVNLYKTKAEATRAQNFAIVKANQQAKADLDYCEPEIKKYSFSLQNYLTFTKEKFFADNWMAVNNEKEKDNIIQILKSLITKGVLITSPDDVKFNIHKRLLGFYKDSGIYRLHYSWSNDSKLYYLMVLNKSVYLMDENFLLNDKITLELLNIHTPKDILEFTTTYVGLLKSNNLPYTILKSNDHLTRLGVKKHLNIVPPKIIENNENYCLIDTFMHHDDTVYSVTLKVHKTKVAFDIVKETYVSNRIVLPKTVYDDQGILFPLKLN